MSLVHEALQKAELEKQRKAGVAPEPHRALPQPTQHFGSPGARSIDPPAMISAGGAIAVGGFSGNAPVLEPQKKSSSLLPGLIGTVSVVAMVAIVFLVSLATSALQDSKRAVGASTVVAPVPAPAADVATPKATTVEASIPIKAEPAPPAVQQPLAQPVEPRFKLSGITKDPDGKYWAIINGQLRSQDQYVDGATVRSVERDRVTLDLGNGQTTVLRLF